MDILTQWQIGYCAGSPMSFQFRQIASQYFQECYNQIKINNSQSKIIVSNSLIYRIIEGKFNEAEVFKNLYYSFSKTKKGLLYFAKKDRHYNSDITLIIATPLEALDFNLLAGETQRYKSEEEVVSKINNNIIKVIYFKTIQELESYLNEYNEEPL